jgi:hypothetical protein
MARVFTLMSALVGSSPRSEPIVAGNQLESNAGIRRVSVGGETGANWGAGPGFGVDITGVLLPPQPRIVVVHKSKKECKRIDVNELKIRVIDNLPYSLDRNGHFSECRERLFQSGKTFLS